MIPLIMDQETTVLRGIHSLSMDYAAALGKVASLYIETSLGSNKLRYSLNHDYNVFLLI